MSRSFDGQAVDRGILLAADSASRIRRSDPPRITGVLLWTLSSSLGKTGSHANFASRVPASAPVGR